MATNEQNQEQQIVGMGVTGGGNVHPQNHCPCHLSLRTPMSARYIYGALFFLGNVVAWVARDNPIKYFKRQRLSGCEGRDCLDAEGVLVPSLACCLFFSIMSLSTVGTSTVQDRRNAWHSQWWSLKTILLAVCIVISIFTPSNVIQLYGQVAHFGAGVFLLIQLVSVIKFVTRLNYRWCQTNFENNYLLVITVSVLAYSGSIVGIILMIFWYTDCLVNIIFIVTTIVLVCLMALISLLLSSKSKGFYMEPALMSAYIVFLCWSGIKSEPDTSCFKKQKSGSGDNWITVITFIVELISTTVATFSTGTDDYKCLHLRNIVATVSNVVPYGYGFFHFVFAMGSMYFGMLFVGWDTHHTSERWSMDVGWTSTWVHIGNEVLAVISYVAVVIARRYGIGWLQQLLGKIFGIGGQQQQENNNNNSESQQPERSDMEGVPPLESRTTEEPAERREADNMAPQESERVTEPQGRSDADNGQQPPSDSHHATESESSETMDDNGPPPPDQSSRGIEEGEGSKTTDDVQPPSSSSSSLEELVHVSESEDSDAIAEWKD